MKDLAFSLLRAVFRFLFFLPRGVRQSWRTLLVWSRLAWVYHRSGAKGMKRFQRVRGVSKDNLRQKSSPKKDSNQTRPPFY